MTVSVAQDLKGLPIFKRTQNAGALIIPTDTKRTLLSIMQFGTESLCGLIDVKSAELNAFRTDTTIRMSASIGYMFDGFVLIAT